VAQALAARAPVVALETTLVTHGLPHPDGIAAASALEDEVRQSGATPATIGVLRGAIRIGISREELDELATTPDVCKTNLSNLAAVVASGGLGSTTVAATMWAAHLNGIRVFATGGIGGVHRGADETGDVSSDLTALGRVPVAVVCAGAKAILDLPRTVEMLETLGVPILGLETDDFPAFYRRSSGLRVDRRVDSIPDLAAAVDAHFRLGLGTGVLVANPIPGPAEMPRDLYD
jgi:pseudouridylate synthase